MRLRLMIQRHGIPPAQVLWTVAPTRPPLAAAGSSITVSQFLEQVNDIIPLESEDWGLEDYAVEIGGYECLHFSEMGQILKDDEEVCIRALQTNDLRARKISGRHQISADGKHLVDGIAFGRPYLRRADRPAIRIPPRKRRRITYDEEGEDSSEEVNDRQIVLRAGLDGADEAVAGDESDGEEDYVPDDDEDDDVSAELEDLREDLHDGATDDDGVTFGMKGGKLPSITTRKSRRSPRGLGLLQLLDEKGRPYAGRYSNPLLDQYDNEEPILEITKRGTARLAQGARRSARNGVLDSSASPEHVGRRSSTGSNKSVRFEDDDLATPATVQDSRDSEEDDDLEPGEVNGSDKENTEPQMEENESSNESSESSKSTSSSFSEEVDSDQTSSSGSSSDESSSESDSDSEPEQLSTKASSYRAGSSDTSSSGSSSRSTESEPRSKRPIKKSNDVLNKAAPLISEEISQPAGASRSPKLVPPGKGKNQTRKRNHRRQRQKKLNYLKRVGLLGAETTLIDLDNFKAKPELENTQPRDVDMRNDLVDNAADGLDLVAKRRALLLDLNDSQGNSKMVDADGDEAGIGSETEGSSFVTAREVKRQKLLTLIAAGGIDANQDIDSQVTPREVVLKHAAPIGAERDLNHAPTTRDGNSKATLTEDEPAAPAASGNDLTTQDVPDLDEMSSAEGVEGAEKEDGSSDRPMDTRTPALKSALGATLSPPSQHRRSKLDLGGAKRMLFGSLGLRTPKTREDESKTREKLMKDVRPVKEPHLDEEDKDTKDIEVIAADNSWKDKIDLRAVECCHEGVLLSTPPFPFAQRWDPQQQGGYNQGNAKKRKGKKRKRNNDDYYQESFCQERQQQLAHPKDYEAPEERLNRPNAKPPGDQIHEPSSDGSFQDSLAVNAQLLRETGDVSADTIKGNDELSTDLPSLPEDPTTCPPLTREIAKPGAVIAFKQLEMSAETNWQPKISDFRTAIVDQITEKGDLCMTPAKRDRRNKQAEYDDQTGERLYTKFEMPGYNDEDDDVNLEISFDELITPILIRFADNQASDGNEEQGRGEDHQSAQDIEDGTVFTQHGNDVAVQWNLNFDGAADVAEDKDIEPSQGAREEISELIKEAGWRSSVQSGVNEGLGREALVTFEREDCQEGTTLIDPPSPRFNGFSSSLVINVRSSPPIVESRPTKRLHASSTEIAESVPPQDSVVSDAKSTISESRSAVEYPTLPQLGDDSELSHEEAQQRSDPLFDHQMLSQDLISNSMDDSPAQSTRSRTRPSQDSNPPKAVQSLDANASEDEFPEPFSQAWENRMSQVRDIKPESSPEDAISPPSYRRLKANGRHSSSQRESSHTWKPDDDCSADEEEEEHDNEYDHEDDGASTPRPSKSQMSSQIVDLTISSDMVDPIDDPNNGDDDSYRLPEGPGWVSKTRASSKRNASTKINAGKAKTQSR